MAWSCRRVSRRRRAQTRSWTSRRKPCRVASSRALPRTKASRRRTCRKQAAATGLSPGWRCGEVINISFPGADRGCGEWEAACAYCLLSTSPSLSDSPPHLLEASHDRERTFFVDGDTEQLAVL